MNVDGGVDGSFGEPGSLLFLYHNIAINYKY